jgi:hypothetical protein
MAKVLGARVRARINIRQRDDLAYTECYPIRRRRNAAALAI